MKLIDGHSVIEHAEVNGESRDFIRKLMDYLEDAPVLQTKLIKYFDEDEKVWTVRAVIISGGGVMDLIKREDAIKAVSEPFDRRYWQYTTMSIRDTVKALKNIPSAEKQGKWIPCSERLPENIRPVLVTWKNNDPASYYQYIVGKHFIGTAHYYRGKWYWYSSVTEDLLAEYGKCETEEFDEAIEAVAWMPLPTAYEGE